MRGVSTLDRLRRHQGYTRSYDVHGNYIARYPATPSNPRR